MRATWKTLRGAAVVVITISCGEDVSPRLAGPGAFANVGPPVRQAGASTCTKDRYVMSDCPDKPSFKKDIFPRLRGVWACTTGACHGGSAAPKIPDTLEESHAALLAYTQIDKKPYVNPCSVDPDASTIACNLGAKGVCGKKMPFAPGIVSAEDSALLLRWVSCGAPLE